MKDKETASKMVRILPSTKSLLNMKRAKINIKRMQNLLPELSAAEVLDLAVKKLATEDGIK